LTQRISMKASLVAEPRRWRDKHAHPQISCVWV